MNTAYKHLDAKLRIASLSVTQWCGVIAGIGVAIGWGMYLHPLSGLPNTVISVYIGGVPALLAWLSAESDVNLPLRARALVRWRRGEDLYLPGAGADGPGYRVFVPELASETVVKSEPVPPSLEALWQ